MSNDSKEIGRVGQRRYGGIFYEEFLSELRGRKGAEVFTEMSNNDETIGAILFAIEMLVRQASWNVEPGGSTAKDREAAEFVKSCMDDMQQTWIDTISEILSFLTYGWSFHEIVYKRRMGRTKDNRTSSKYDDHDNLIGMTQMPPPDFGLITIPMNKAMLFRTRSRKDNPEGRSILRTAYRSWYFKRRIQEIEGIGIERDLAGLPVITTPEGMDIWDKDDEDMNAIRAGLEAMVKNIRRDSTEGLVLPFGYTFELTSTGGSRQFDTNSIIARYDTKISQTVLADFIQLGHESVGSFALSSDKTNLFSMAICAFLDIICQTFNSQGIPALIDINGDYFAGVTDYPRLTHGDIEDVDLATMATFIKDMTSIGVIIPDESLEDYVRQLGKLPKRTTDTVPMEARRAAQQQGNEPPEPETAAGKGHDGEEGFEDNGSRVSAARKRLGRE